MAVPAGTVPNYLVQSILVTLCCCLPFGVVAVVYAAQVNAKLQAGDLAGARDASDKAKMWSWIGFGLGLLSTLAYIGLMGVGEFAKR
ncbi:MAG TPA: CD225/dispanin family protein [Thermoanaerobaculia bacterium]|nr:CD225/dispanin family protein [Thermoanaerobaculia bacterium]